MVGESLDFLVRKKSSSGTEGDLVRMFPWRLCYVVTTEWLRMMK